MKKLILFLLIGMFCLSLVSAVSHKQNTDLVFSESSNFATYCTLTTINTPTQVLTINQNGTNNLQTFNWTVSSGNFEELGNYKINIVCSDGTDTVTGYVELEVTPSGDGGTSNIVFFIFAIFLLYSITFFGFFGKNIPITILGGMAMIFLGVWLINNGIIIFRNDLTNYISYVTIGVGVITSFWAMLEQLEVI